jgi:hypothetical protein
LQFGAIEFVFTDSFWLEIAAHKPKMKPLNIAAAKGFELMEE